MLTNGYPTHKEHHDEEIRNMSIKPESIKSDRKGMDSWVRQLGPDPSIRWYCDEGSHKADTKAVRGVLKKGPRAQPTLIYIAGHTETQITAGPSSGQFAYAPADYLNTNPSGQPQLIPASNSQLPYMLEYEGNEARWVQTGYPGISTGTSSEIVHFAATAPDERAAAFESGALFTKAFYNINPSEARSLKDIVKQLQENMSKILSSGGSSPGTIHSQHPKVYSSRIIDEPHFFAALQFFLSDSAADTNSESSG
ncbi:unnamed protein product [Rhizoctonia solani]|uniref:Uncharacterized protein n=1 Tax=Rhizoctonia solani TaxID=456999 RepID=A0A8H3DGD0_9AGAM|nr:unnamed protein product [Rhizoctonia solani]